MHDLTEVTFQSFAAGYFETPRIESQLVKHCCVQIGDVMPILGRMETEFVGGSPREPWFDSAARSWGIVNQNNVSASKGILFMIGEVVISPGLV